MSDKIRKPTLKERVFAKEYVKNMGDGKKAALVAYDTTPIHAPVIAHKVKSRPVVQKLIGELLDDKYPDHTADYMALMQMALKKAQDGTATLKEMNETLKVFADISGYKAPKETHTKSLKAVVKLPGSE